MAKIFISGDFCPQSQMSAAIKSGKHLFDDSILNIIKNTDYSIINMECPVEPEHPSKILKDGPLLHTNGDSIKYLKSIGFDCLSLANNHLRDMGDNGVLATIQECKNNNLDFCGAGKNISEAEQILFKDINGIKIGIISVCENESSIAEKDRAGAAPIDPIDVSKRIRIAKEKADYVIVICHGGHEQYQLPSPRMQKWYRFFCEEGASFVINHHQHCYSGHEQWENGHIFYGLGNFCFETISKQRKNHEGYAVVLNLEHNSNTFEIVPYTQCNFDFQTKMMSGNDKSQFEEELSAINSIITNPEQLEDKFKKNVCIRKPQTIFLPYTNRILRALYRRNLLPSFLSDKHKAEINNHIRCESHRDLIIEYYRQIGF